MDLNVLGASRISAGGYLPAYSSGSQGDFPAMLAQAAGGGETGYDNLFQAAADAYQLPVDLLKGVAKAESAFTADAVSHCGAQGIMQLMPGTARALGVTDSFDPAQNIMGGAKYLRQMADRFDGDLTKVLAAYNAGPGAVEQYGGVPPYQETQNYVQKVMGYMGSPTSAIPASSGYGAYDGSALGVYPGLDGTAALGALTGLDGASSGAALAQAITQVFKSSGSLSEDSVRMFLGQLVQNKLYDQDEEPWAI